MSVAVILNSQSHAGRGAKIWERFLQAPEGRVFRDSPAFRGGKAELKAWIQEHYARGVRDWVVAGGDGTVHLAINLFMQLGIHSEVRVGAVGVGSSNDFHKPFLAEGRARASGLPTRIDFARAKRHDLGRVYLNDSKEPIHFAVNSSVGVTAEANLRFNQAGPLLRLLKKTWTDGAIVATALKTFAFYRNISLSIGIDSQPVRVIEVTNAGIVKNRFFSGSFRYDEGMAVPAFNDGTLGFFLCRDMGKGEMLRALVQLSKGRFSGLPKTESQGATTLEISSPAGQSFCIEADGEVQLASKARYDVIREAIALCP